MPRKTPTTRSKPQLRIIGGQWRGRKLAIADVDGLRPTGDRIRETLFNWLQQDIRDARCLDLFAGSGALGFEALSRGAASVLMLEKNTQAVSTLREHCDLLNIEAASCEIVKSDSLAWLANGSLQPGSIDIVFIDPPFAQNLWQASFDALAQSNCLSDDALIYIESPKNLELSLPLSWQLHREKMAGDVGYGLYTLVS